MAATSDTFNASSGGDVIFRSSDGVLFFVHKDALGYCSGGFPDGDAITVDPEPVPLTESSSVLEILFQFVYPRKQPALDDMKFSLFLAVAEAAEKYEVYFAMNICQLRMKEYLPAQASAIFGFAGKHNYPYLIAAASPLLIGKPLTEIARVLPPHLFVPWALYQEQWSICLNRSLFLIKHHSNCQNWPRCQQAVQKIQDHLLQNMAGLLKIETVVETLVPRAATALPYYVAGQQDSGWCSYCQKAVWKEAIQKQVATVPDFLTFWKGYNIKAGA